MVLTPSLRESVSILHKAGCSVINSATMVAAEVEFDLALKQSILASSKVTDDEYLIVRRLFLRDCIAQTSQGILDDEFGDVSVSYEEKQDFLEEYWYDFTVFQRSNLIDLESLVLATVSHARAKGLLP